MKLKDIKTPKDIKGLGMEELEDLARQMREAVLHRCSLVSGHVSSNLGDIELVLAMHYVFEAPKDKLVYDVSHQDFPHKMLTGRADGFLEASCFGKVGEYTDPKESPEYDVFYAGHTSPAISLCTGLAKGRELTGDDYRIVALVGDGSLSGGEAFEGLNVGANIRGNFIVIINDNQMSIAPNYGGIYRGLQRLRETNGTADDNLFRAFGWDYVYVAEGNDVRSCVSALEKVRDSQRPVVVHVNTQKGEGYAPAERDREKFHYFGPFVIETGDAVSESGAPDYVSMTKDYLLKKCDEMPELLILSSATPGVFDFMEEERERAGEHYLDVDIAEQTGVSVMAGASRAGAKVVYPIVGSFMQRAYDQMIEDWAMNDSPAVMLVLCSGIHGIADLTHLGFWDIPFVTSMPGVVYLAPTNAEEYMAMLDWAVNQRDHKVAIRVPTYSFEHAAAAPDTDYSTPDRFKVMKSGSRVALIGAGDFYVKACRTADELAKHGIDATLINPRYLSGVDTDLLMSLEKDHEVVAVLEDGSLEGGFAQRVAAALGASDMKTLCFGLPKKFEDRYDADELEKKDGLLSEQIAASIMDVLSE